MNKKCNPIAAIGMAVLRGFMYVLICLCFILTVLSFTLRHTIAERDLYRQAAENPDMAPAMVEYARGELESECLFYDIPFDIVDQSISQEVASDFVVAYVDAVYDAVFVSGNLVIPTVDAALFRAPLATMLAEENVDDTTLDALATEFAAVTTAVWQMGLSQKIITPVHKIAHHALVVKYLNGGALLAGITALLLGIGLLLGLRRIRRQVFDLLGTLTVGSMVLFVPLWLLHREGLAAKLMLGDSPLRLFVVHLLDSFTAQLSTISMWVLIIAAVLTVLSVVWVVWPKNTTNGADASDDSAPEELPAASAEEI